jgi:seryl-tRNA synthetase
MSALDVAEQHLTEALSRLEHALAHRLAAADPDKVAAVSQLADERDSLHRDVETLRAECERLSAALQKSEQNRETLRQTTGEVAERLDNSIDRLDSLIEE